MSSPDLRVSNKLGAYLSPFSCTSLLLSLKSMSQNPIKKNDILYLRKNCFFWHFVRHLASVNFSLMSLGSNIVGSGYNSKISFRSSADEQFLTRKKSLRFLITTLFILPWVFVVGKAQGILQPNWVSMSFSMQEKSISSLILVQSCWSSSLSVNLLLKLWNKYFFKFSKHDTPQPKLNLFNLDFVTSNIFQRPKLYVKCFGVQKCISRSWVFMNVKRQIFNIGHIDIKSWSLF